VLVAYLCLAPWLIGFVVFTAYPVIATAYYSLTDFPILGEPQWIGLDNYRDLLDDPLFWKSLRVTAVFCLVAVPGSILIGYVIALLLNRRVRWVSGWRTIYFLPSIMPAVAGAFLWSWMFNPDFGLVNAALDLVGIDGPDWFVSQEWVLPAFIIMTLWAAGGGMILYLAALQQVPTVLYEAAALDGAGGWRQLRHVTIPLTSPIILFTFVTGLIGSFQIFTAGFILTGGGPNNASLFYVLYLYQRGWEDFEMGYASALAWVLLLIMLGLTFIVLKMARRFVHYEFEGQ
jgi:multiple sugar transport system permease protein